MPKPVYITACAFVDDVVLVANSINTLQENLNLRNEDLKWFDLVINLKETEIMEILMNKTM